MPDDHRYWIPEILEYDDDADADTELDPIHGFCAFSLEHQQQDDDSRRTGGFCRRNDYGALELSLCFYLNSVADMFVRLGDFEWEN